MNKIVSSLITIILLVFVSNTVYSQSKGSRYTLLKTGYYVVAGVYSVNKESYAKSYTAKLKSNGIDADYGLFRPKNYFYVYVAHSDHYREAIDLMKETRQNTDIKDAWVFVCLNNEEAQTDNAEVEEEVAEKVVEKKPQEVSEVEANDVDSSAVAPVDSVAYEEKDDSQVSDSEGGLSVFFNLINSRNNKDVNGEVQVIDQERFQLLNTKKAGEYTKLKDPNNGTGKLLLLCDVFGFRKDQKELNYYHPLQDTVSEDIFLVGEDLVVKFDLVRYRKGDIITMYNVYFFRDAAVMRPESHYEVNQLLEMLQENENYKIRIHGHTNGRASGKMIAMGSSKTFFALSDENKTSIGSAKKLSGARAQVIKDFLVANGVPEDRMEIKAWGGRRMLYDKNSSKADRNVRVEIEILED